MSTSLVLTPLKSKCDSCYPCEPHYQVVPPVNAPESLADLFAVKKTTIETFVRTGGSGILTLKEFNRGFY
jgi:hypothetical protein